MAVTPSRHARVVRSRIGIRERIARLWHYRELLVAMIRTELKVRYKNSALGFAWSLVNPLLYLVVFYIAFDLILGAGIPAFPLFLLSGLLVWNLYSAGLGAATGAVVGNAGLIKKVSFPREILPLASIGAALVHFFLQSAVLAAAFLVTRWNVAWAYIPLLPLALIALLLLTAGLGILLGSINVYLRDTQHFLELALLAWFWMTPIVYGFMTIGSRGGWGAKVYMLNPITPVVILFQRALYAKTGTGAAAGSSGGALKNAAGTQILPDWSWTHYLGYLGYTMAAGIILFTFGLYVFGRLEANFAEEL
jgi:ABC-2 type transport system permease protein